MNSFETAVARELAKRLDEETARQIEIMVSGLASDYADYKEKSAVIRTLAQVKAWLKDVEIDLNA
jgi:hypothetical protein